MNSKIIVAISVSMLIKWTTCLYLEQSANFLKPKLERNNIVNKKIWVKKAQEDAVDKTHLGNFIFRPDSMDVGFLQNAFDRFGENNMQETPFVTGYVQRARRSPEHIRKRRPRKSMNKKHTKTIIEDSAMIKSKIVSDLKPASVFNEYPYEVAMLLNNGEKGADKIAHKNNSDRVNGKVHETSVTEEDKLKVLPLFTSTKSIAPKRSKKYDHDVDNMKKFNLINGYNSTDVDHVNNNLIDQGVYEKDERIWNQNNAPISDSNIYKVITKEPEKDISSKGVTERGLIKVIAMLTRTFKKIMKQHNDIKTIHDKLIQTNQDFDQKVAELFLKFDDFDSKYSDMVHFNNKIKEVETKLNSAQEYLKKKYKTMESSFVEFHDQQKKFMEQQKQFYGIQKLMLEQNDKINNKQNRIAKTQSEISHRQNNFARILKKAKQVLIDKKSNSTARNQNDKFKSKIDNSVLPISTTTAPDVQSMKINLFSIPTKSKLENQDELIIKEKDDRQIDDLVYKYYFNNTFIDSLMKSKILNNYVSNGNRVDIVRNTKNKRDQFETTIMIPMAKNLTEPVNRTKRWINSFGKKYRRIAHHSTKPTENVKIAEDPSMNKVESIDKSKSDPYVAMATSFCKQVGQNINDQSLKWCVEKALRRLKMMEMMTYPAPPTTLMSVRKPQQLIQLDQTNSNTESQTNRRTTLRNVPTTVVITQDLVPVTKEQLVTPLYPVSSTQGTFQEVYFPDNDELESNLKQYELKPDTEGNIYYEGSVHISDFGHLASTPESDSVSDVLPGLIDSNSRVDIDPMTFDLQAKRRAYVRRINDEMMKKIRAG